MRIGELSRRTGVSPRLLRYYEAQGLLEAERGPNAYREYDETAVPTVRRIRALLDAGLSTEVIREVLPCVRDERPTFDWCEELRRLLESQLASVNARMATLDHTRRTLTTYLTQP
ncbi:MerR family transcriptional regulator [Streptomyces sp. SW4]|nr:MerR family transcriptional regulator [Streptomyces sp. SW4]